MPRANVLSDAQLQAALAELPGWEVVNGKLHKTFKFSDFTAAFGFMTKVAIEANTMNHHPEWCNVWNRVTIDLVTHEAGDRISDLDVTLARKIESLV
ncbi:MULTISPECIES: 4a-hydroxytetrahydrobiopterin dehydratase [Caldilinea]|jgi:4a-hydroxytetrahydrobiopterin dehydratase|uniref:Putative pterin-4-alpha-carbinolamine dehydratase n=2 Tax=Caldilinea aerophila TaxID=133453 RepID=I0I1Q6_CALAS|nr:MULTISPECIES: 4a-hydroxytetrahydrobiopterin dehydratase [Caldilinea]MBO9394761.1 4a-hydroxytetrahydrobiopterin dehydratase [Caldilinea sp.]BAL99193.1 putative pterin-4-alpha-carbinolamine dehydratase [Caldilinea aerophila DSM 14535 = NBRC 104270]GIV74214.1 MAG: putative pterin-4-alpha-carbinolamine dehydratase [Caldilinea sp.]